MRRHDEIQSAAVGRLWRDDQPYEFLTELIEAGDRMGGHAGERRAAELFAETVTDLGARDATVESFEMNRWSRGTTSFAVTEPVERSFEAIALPYSPGGEVSGELVDVGHGTPEEVDDADVRGKIAVASTTTPESYGRFIHRMEKFGYAAAAGADAFVFVNHKPGQLPPTGALQFDAEAPMPGVGVSKETGAWLREYAERGGRATLNVDAITEAGTSHNAHAVFGPETDDEILVVAHLDAHDIAEGALDNGCGVAVVVGIAKLLAEFDLPVQVRVAGVGCEELGLMGAETLASSLDLDRVRAVVNVDGAGRFRNLRTFTHASSTMEAVTETVAAEHNQPIAVEPEPHPFSDHWPFLRRGVPALQLHSESAERGRGWTHTTADTRDKVDPRNLREHAILGALFVETLAERDVPRADPTAVANALRDADYERGMRAADIWPGDWN